MCLNKSDLRPSSPADSTGTHSLYTTYQGYEVMFHVSTMLPYMPSNPQQVRACDRCRRWCEELTNTSIKKSPRPSHGPSGKAKSLFHFFLYSAPRAFMAFVLCVQLFLCSLISFFFCPPILSLDQSWVRFSSARFLCLKNL